MQCHKNNWLDIFSGFRVAFSLKKILLATCGLYITVIVLLVLLAAASHWWPEMPNRLQAMLDILNNIQADSPEGRQQFVSAIQQLELTRVFGDEGLSARCIGFLSGTAIILLAIWSFFGGAICRLSAVDFSTDETVSLSSGTGFVWKRFGSFFWSPLVPFVVVVMLLLGASLIGVIGRIGLVGPPAMGILSFVAIMIAGIALLVLLCAVVGMIFSWPTIAVEGTNAFDAISRSFNYVLARPWKLIWSALVASAYGLVCVVFVGLFTWVLLRLTLAVLAFGMGAEAFEPLRDMALVTGHWQIGADTPTQIVIAGIALKSFFILAWGFAAGFAISLEMTMWTLIYYVIRRDVDGTDMSEVFLPESPEEVEAALAAESIESPSPATSEKAAQEG